MIVRAVPSIDELVAEHLWLVESIVRKLQGYQCVKRIGDEAVSVGHFALVKAARAYDASKGASFKTYATMKISFAVRLEAAKTGTALGSTLVNPNALAADCHQEPVEIPKKKRRRRKLWNPVDGWRSGRCL